MPWVDYTLFAYNFQNEKQHQLQIVREQHYKLMLEKEQRHVDLLRSQLAQSPDEKKYLELEKSERNVQKLQGLLQNHVRDHSQVVFLLRL